MGFFRSASRWVKRTTKRTRRAAKKAQRAASRETKKATTAVATESDKVSRQIEDAAATIAGQAAAGSQRVASDAEDAFKRAKDGARQGIHEAAEWAGRTVEDGTDAVLRSKAARDAERLGRLISALGQSALGSFQFEADLLRRLEHLAAARDPVDAHDSMVALARSDAFRPTLKLADDEAFLSFSYGVGAGGSAVLGSDGCVGFAIGIPELSDSLGFVGVGGSFGAQGGGSVDCQFALWARSPRNLEGGCWTIQGEAAAKVGAGVQLVYEIPSLELVGLLFAPKLGAEGSLALGRGYTWVFPA